MPVQPNEPLSYLRGRQRDALPENTDYRDRGCAVSPSCLSCPLPECVLDDTDAKRRAARDRELADFCDQMHRAYHRLTVLPEAAAKYGLSVRQLQRVLPARSLWRD